ncbi:MAG: glyoxalase [Saprospiraceae bacterium]|nr:glyoxalase [Saprospiraceae bacterium]
MNQDRNTGLQRLRPAIQVNLTENPENSAGHFQNATLRPILKLQNELLLQIFRQYLQKSKGSFFQLNRPEKLAFIANSIRRDLHFRNLLTGVIIGHFTEEEWIVFAGQEQELTRRIADLLIQRLSDQVELFLPL